jgi:DNA-binding transcriptional LysR family regulator
MAGDYAQTVLSPYVPDLGALEVLLTVAQEGSLGAAARAHGVSQPAVSARIRGLERQVGFPVVDRGARGSTLTPRGALLAEWAQAVIDAARELDAGLDALRTSARARLRLAASLTLAEHLLPEWLARWRVRRPEVHVSLTAGNTSETARRVLDGEADLGFVEGPVLPAGLSARPVATDRLVVVCAPGHPWARRRRPLTVAELAAAGLVTREASSGTRAAFEQSVRAALTSSGEPLPAPVLQRPVLELSTTSAVRAAVAAGAGPAAISDLAARDDLTAGRLVEVPVAGLDLRRTLRAVWPRGQRPTGPARDLLALVGAAERGGSS